MIPWCDVIILAFLKLKTLNCGKMPSPIPKIFACDVLTPHGFPGRNLSEVLYALYSGHLLTAISESFRDNCSKSRQIKIFFQYSKWILLAVKSPFQIYIFCWGMICRSKIIGGAAPSHLHLLFCKIVCWNLSFSVQLKIPYFLEKVLFKGGAYRNICTFGGTLI